MEALDRAHELLATWTDELLRELPADVEIFDAHVHLGDDIDGMRGRPDELLGMMDEYGVGRAFMFCLDEPDRHPGFRAPNDRTLAYARGVERPPDPVRPPRPERGPDRGGEARASTQARAASSSIRARRRSRSRTSG